MFYYYTFYKIYSLLYRIGNKDITEWSAMTFMSLLIYVNLYTALLYLKVDCQYDILITRKSIAIFIFIFILFFNYWLLIRKNKYVIIVTRFGNEKVIMKWLGSFLVLIYVFITIKLFYMYVNKFHDLI